MKKIFFIASILLVWYNTALAQYLPVGMDVLEDYYRREQLLGRVDSNISFTNRPVITSTALNTKGDIFYPEDPLAGKQKHKVEFAGHKGLFYVLPLTMQHRFNSNFPYGWNDGPMISAKGYQTIVSGGIFIKYGVLTIQLKPEFVYATNNAYRGFASYQRSDSELASYYRYHNYIDQPERLANGAYTKAFIGQSSIRLNFDPISIGLSNENLWWGPGINNALVMSNNAPGFKHLTLNTTKPIGSFLGDFEGQIIAARLDGTNLAPLEVTQQSNGRNLYMAKSNNWRYFTGFNMTYHPRWITGLNVGLTRTFAAYSMDVNQLRDYIPFFISYQKRGTNGDPIPRDQRTSIYGRWLFTKAKAEIYFEYGVNDNSYDFRDFAGSPDHSRAYIFGFRKILPIHRRVDEFIMVGGEITQISKSPDKIVEREGTPWYTHYQIRQGYTHMGQILGAGGGGNMQNVEVSWVSGLKKLGINFERYEHNTDLTDRSFSPVNGNSRNWVDVSVALHGEWNYQNFIFSGRIQQIKALNYQWFMKDYVENSYYVPNNNAYNLFAHLGATYRF